MTTTPGTAPEANADLGAGTSSDEAPARESGRHPVEVGYLVMGIALLGLVAAWALIVGDVVEGDDVRWLAPMPWVLAGAAGLGAMALSSRRSRAERPADRAVPPAETAPVPEDEVHVEDTAPIGTTGTDSTTDTDTDTDTDEEVR